MAEGLRGTDGRGRADGILKQDKSGRIRTGDIEDQENQGQGNPGPVTAGSGAAPGQSGDDQGGTEAEQANTTGPALTWNGKRWVTSARWTRERR